ncbi:MAG TPA: tRNA epoxyqueuosine(34) reductase QueG [Pseudomonadales bacterium]|nr:tRNA epoxyqueuosine(34) reductase QueG [Pseudomonadales bacterium]
MTDQLRQDNPIHDADTLAALADSIRQWAKELGFQAVAISDAVIERDAQHLRAWLDKQYHGEMHFMAEHAEKRANPALLEPGTVRCISLRMDYLDRHGADPITILNDQSKAYISRYALGRDYHKLVRKRIAQLVKRIQAAIPSAAGRAFVDSAPVLERALAQRAGLGWIGKNSMLINDKAGSWFFLGELFTNLALPVDPPQQTMHCGSCSACLPACPTQAIVAPFQVDGRRCISYLTIELKGAIPEPFRKPMGNRVFGCDDCQLACPWNKFAGHNREDDFKPRHGLDNRQLSELFLWSEEEYLQHTEGSAIRRIGYRRWLRNLAVGLGNAPTHPEVIAALQARLTTNDTLVLEHVHWALAQHGITP